MPIKYKDLLQLYLCEKTVLYEGFDIGPEFATRVQHELVPEVNLHVFCMEKR